tara:strand:+ start:686 stop:1285 length:600 start_codon:yes stop_codon:yes gene_type:complete
LKKIYLISPNKLNKNFYIFLPKILATRKIKFLQLRCKYYSKKILIKHIRKILPITKKYKVKLIINDDAQLAYRFENVGFHSGQNDLKKNKKIMRLSKNIVFGITCHNSLSLARKAILLDSTYIAFGAFFPTKTKKVKYVADKNILKKAKNLNTKIVAIGGITNKNYKVLLKDGADFIAISSFVWKNKEFNPLEAIKLFK